MSADSSSMPALKILIRFALTVGLVYLLSTFLNQYFFVSGGLRAYLIIGSLITLLNILVRPILYVLTLPFRIFALILAIIIANGLFLWITERIASQLNPSIVRLEIDGGAMGWIFIAILLGLANWIFKEIVK